MNDEACYYDRLIDATGFVPQTYGDSSAWIEHIPFASWIIRELSPAVFVQLGTHAGSSYFAFCQSVLEHERYTKCYAVDNRKGDERYKSLNSYNSENYSGFSSLLHVDFDEAIGNFSDDSIGLLHIDGSNTYGAAKNNFESWMPKMAKGGVILLHNTNAEEGWVREFFEDLKKEYPHHLEFIHGHGLGVVQVKLDEDLALGFLEKDSHAKQQVFNLFSRLGIQEIHRYNRSVDVNSTTGGSDEKGIRLLQSEESLFAQVSSLTKVVKSNEQELRAVNHEVSEYEREFDNMRQSVLSENRDLTMQVRQLNELVDSARRWNKRSWVKRAFHKWRPEPRASKKRGLFKRIKNSYRKRIRN